MTTTKKIAAEAIKRSGDVITERTVMIAIELARDEVLRTLWPLNNTDANIPDEPTAYILTGTPWNDLVRYIQSVEKRGITCTNTAFNEWTKEIDRAEFCIAIKGWNETKQGREKGAYIKCKGKKIRAINTFDNETRKELGNEA